MLFILKMKMRRKKKKKSWNPIVVSFHRMSYYKLANMVPETAESYTG